MPWIFGAPDIVFFIVSRDVACRAEFLYARLHFHLTNIFNIYSMQIFAPSFAYEKDSLEREIANRTLNLNPRKLPIKSLTLDLRISGDKNIFLRERTHVKERKKYKSAPHQQHLIKHKFYDTMQSCPARKTFSHSYYQVVRNKKAIKNRKLSNQKTKKTIEVNTFLIAKKAKPFFSERPTTY